MVEGWELDTHLRSEDWGFRRILIVALAILIVVGALLLFLSGSISGEQAILMVVIGVLISVADLLYNRWLEKYLDKMAKRYVKRFRLPMADVKQRLESGFYRKSVPYDGGKRDYRVIQGHDVVDLHLQAAGEWTYVYVGPPEADTDVGGLLEFIVDMLT